MATRQKLVEVTFAVSHNRMIAGTSAFLASAATRVKNIYLGHSEFSERDAD